MRTVLDTSGIADTAAAVGKVEAFARDNGLTADAGTLKIYPGSIHWHLKHPKQKGVLEITWWPQKREFWAEVRSNRSAPWALEALSSFAR